jgi:hypothetical protein
MALQVLQHFTELRKFNLLPRKPLDYFLARIVYPST